MPKVQLSLLLLSNRLKILVILPQPEHCRVLFFEAASFSDKVLNKSIIKNLTVKDEQLCQLRCFVEETCKSYNLGPPDSGGEGKRVCELSSSHHVLHPDYLVSKSGFTYRPSEVGNIYIVT